MADQAGHAEALSSQRKAEILNSKNLASFAALRETPFSFDLLFPVCPSEEMKHP
jgi:hypothetical protein